MNCSIKEGLFIPIGRIYPWHAICECAQRFTCSTSSCFVFVVSHVRCGLGELVPLTPFGPRFKMERKLMSQSLSRRAVAKWEPYLLEEMQTFLKDLIATPDEFVSCLRRYATCILNSNFVHLFYIPFSFFLNSGNRMSGSLIFRAIYGYRAEKNNDPYVKAAEELMDISTYAITGPWLVNFVPLCKRFIQLSLNPNQQHTMLNN